MGLGISLRSLYPKTLENLHHNLLVFLCDRLLRRCFWRHLCHYIPTSFSFNPFSLWAVWPCYVIFYNLKYQFKYQLQYNVCASFWNGFMCCYYYLVCIFVVMVLKVHLELFFSDRVTLVQYLFICCLLFKLMKKASFGF